MRIDLRDTPARVVLNEVGPRDGFQNLSRILDTALKLEIIAGLAEAGLREIQVTSFVHPAKVPQMADAEAVVAGLPRLEGLSYSALVLNRRGVERAAAAGIDTVEVSLSVNDAHSRNNTGMDPRQALAEGCRMVRHAKATGLGVVAGLQCAFGYPGPDDFDPIRVAAAARALLAEGPKRLALCDTAGMADPRRIVAILDSVAPLAGDIPLALHLHDTRGLGLVNLFTGLCRGVVHFDTALGGMGGCPFIPGAAGNLATEEAVFLLERLDVDTGVDLTAVARLSRRLEAACGAHFSGRLHRRLAP
jgi:hydroxymethylglutaryl-CoA lyase